MRTVAKYIANVFASVSLVLRNVATVQLLVYTCLSSTRKRTRQNGVGIAQYE